MKDSELLLNIRGIIDELLSNASHSFGINFKRLNETAIEVDKRIFLLGIDTQKEK
jgi:hypothetical protein